jgi:uncharacterized protein YjbJ (UPF0337 family)
MGIAENVKGAIKEKVGDATDNDALEAEGKAQREKGAEEVEATKARAEAQAHEKKADALDAEQSAVEGS